MHVDGTPTANKVSVWVPRQNGKGGIIEALELYWLFIVKDELIVHSAHQHRTSQKAYERLERIIRSTPFLHKQVQQYRQANGEQQIELKDGRMLQYTTRSRTAVRGFSAKKLVLDEAQELTPEQMAAILPTVSAMGSHWQVWFFGTPPDDPAAYVYGLKEDGEAGTARLAHFDWGLDLDLENPDDKAKTLDRRNWYLTNPALGIRIAETTVEDESKPSGLGDKFAQERLGVWQPRAAANGRVIDRDLWLSLADRQAQRPEELAFAVDVSPDRTSAAICMAGTRDDGNTQVAIIDHRRGTNWVVQRLAELREQWDPVAIAIDGRSPAAALRQELEEAGFMPPDDLDEPERGRLALLSASDAGIAWGMFVDAARQRKLRHSDDAPLTLALDGAKTRNVGDGSAWARRGTTDITPLVGVTEALWALLTLREKVRDDADPSAFWL
jgi:phage terminase large subunit-like protein